MAVSFEDGNGELIDLNTRDFADEVQVLTDWKAGVYEVGCFGLVTSFSM